MDKLMTRKELAEMLGLSPATLARWKRAGEDSPPCIKIGKSVRYRREDVMEWLYRRAGLDAAAVTCEQRT
jgi:excisionase family DNA binding protein